ncbi:MAG: hypothetical protein FJY07_07025, partial [Bacteroidetes bacterium]|nr:hypothetical protein [Bacteroidota bacterium]
MKRVFFWLFTAGILFSCSITKEHSATTISCTFPALYGKMLYIEELDVKKKILLDSLEIASNGMVNFNPVIEKAGFFIIRTTPENYILLLIEPGEKAEIFCADSTFGRNYEIINSPGSLLLKDFETFMAYQKTRIDSLGNAYFQGQNSDNFLTKKTELDSIYKIVFNDQRRYVTDFVNENPGSLASLIVLNRKFGSNTVLDEEEDFIYFHRVDSALLISHPGNKHTIDHNNRVK